MTLHSDGETTHFSLSRQAATVGRCSFVLEDPPMGGCIDVTVTRENLDLYLTELTYHTGREEFPRYPNDDSSMNDDGSRLCGFQNEKNRSRYAFFHPFFDNW